MEHIACLCSCSFSSEGRLDFLIILWEGKNQLFIYQSTRIYILTVSHPPWNFLKCFPDFRGLFFVSHKGRYWTRKQNMDSFPHFNSYFLPTRNRLASYFLCPMNAYMEKAHVATGSPFFGVRRSLKFFGVFTVLSVAAPIFWRFYAVLPVAAS